VTGRYEIQDILTQDASGVVFHAEDRESGKSVVLRRFFPYGPDGGGLQEAERKAYLAALARLREVRHPVLRTILDGGCDPVDGIPFLVAEWVEGQRLSELLKERALSPSSTKALLTHALEASLVLAEAFGEEAVWVEASPESVILPAEGENLTFWACPLKWLGDPAKRGGLLPLAKLAEKSLHWRGKPVAGTAQGLGSWVKAVRENPDRWTLQDAITALNEPLTMSSLPVQKPGMPTIPMALKKKKDKEPAKKKSAFVPILLALVVGGAAAGGGFYFLKLKVKKGAALADAPRTQEIPRGTSALEFGARSTAKETEAESATPISTNEPAKSPAPAVPPPGKVTLTGKVVETETSKSAKTRYLKITVDGAKDPRWVGYQVSQQAKGLEPADLDALKNKRVQVSGDERKEDSHRKAVLHIKSRDQIKVLD
jgi:flagellar basal body-associated protein FliL